jgi:hypothetical protein
MSEKYGNQSTFNRLRKSRRAQTALLAAGLALVAGCSAAKATGSSGGGKSKAVAVGARTPGTTPATASSTAPSTAPPIRTSPASRADWCKNTATIIEEAFVDPNAPQECEVMPTSATPGDVLIKYTLNTAGATDYSVELSVLNTPFKQFTGAAKPTSGSGTEFVVIPNSTMMYVEVPGNPQVTGELELLSGEGGTDPLGYQNMIPQAAGAFAVFGSESISQLYPAGAQ